MKLKYLQKLLLLKKRKKLSKLYNILLIRFYLFQGKMVEINNQMTMKVIEFCSKCGAVRVRKWCKNGMMSKMTLRLRGIKCRHKWPSDEDEIN